MQCITSTLSFLPAPNHSPILISLSTPTPNVNMPSPYYKVSYRHIQYQRRGGAVFISGMNVEFVACGLDPGHEPLKSVRFGAMNVWMISLT